jgi:hypothetical protein
MGGFGSGRNGGKRCTDDVFILDVRKLNRMGLLHQGQRFTWQWTCNDAVIGQVALQVQVDQIVLDYRSSNPMRNGGSWESLNYPVQLEWTPCTLGGKRVWWRCPAIGCRRRVAVLYGGRFFACRHCHELAYRCQRETDQDRAERRANVIRQRLGWDPGILHGNGTKPKGMHWSTFERLKTEQDAFANASLAGLDAWIGLMNR